MPEHITPEPMTIVGSTVAALVAALAAARAGNNVALCLDPARIGGTFAGIQTGPWHLDLGPRLFELAYEDTPPRPITAFDPATGSHRPAIAAVAAFIAEILDGALTPAPQPELWIEARRIPCPLMTVDLAPLAAALPSAERALIAGQAEAILQTPTHPATTLAQASLANHGPHLHARLIQPVCARQHAGWAETLASERRKLWAALFHPRTVHEAFAGRTIGFRPHRPVHTTPSGQAHPFVTRLHAAVSTHSRIACHHTGPLTTLTPQPGSRLTLTFPTKAVTVPSATCVIAIPPDQLFRAAGIGWSPARITASILWLETPSDAVRHTPSALTIADLAIPAFRIAHAASYAGRTVFSVETGAAPACPDVAARALRATGLVAPYAPIQLRHRITAPAQLAPTAANRTAFHHAMAQLATRLGALPALLAATRRFGFDGLNDQIADGLHFGECRC